MLRRVALVRTDVPLKQEPHGVTSKKMAFFIVNAVKTSNSTLLSVMHLYSGINGLNTHIMFSSMIQFLKASY
jgi:hypothetical protein